MDSIIITQDELLPEYKSQDWWWRNIMKKLTLLYAQLLWSHHAIVMFPLMIEIELGLMRYYFYKDGLLGVRRRIMAYNFLLSKRLEGHSIDLDPTDYHEIKILTDEEDILEYEIQQLDPDY